MKNDWKDRLGVVFSTNPDYQFTSEEEEEVNTLPKTQQKLRVVLDRHNRKGKIVTLIQGFVGKEDDLKQLERFLKAHCGVGGSSKDGEIIIQGSLVEKVRTLLEKEGYKVK